MDIKFIIRDYKKRKLCRALAELDDFRTLPTLDRCINNAALAIHQNGKRYRHQYRLSKVTLSTARTILLGNAKSIKEIKSFDDLFILIGNLLKSVNGIGELYIYDTSLRVGAYLDHLPQKVYLHSGTRKGARRLGFRNKNCIKMSEFKNGSKDFKNIEPFMVEDILCLYKDEFVSIKFQKDNIENQCDN